MALITLQPAQVAELTNDALKNTLGEETTLLTEDLSNVVDIGTTLANANVYKNFVDGLMVATAKYIFRYRKYQAKAPNVLRDNYEYGQLIQKIKSKLPESRENQSWQLTNNASYDDNQFIADDVEVTIFMKQITFEVRKSITDDQIKNAFTNSSQLGSFVSMQLGNVQNKLELDLENLVYRTMNNYMGELIYNNTGDNQDKRVIKLLTLYKSTVPNADQTLTSDTCLYDKGFLIFASSKIMDYVSLMQRYSVAYNNDGFETFTPENLLHVNLYTQFVKNMAMYAESSTFHDEYIKLPEHFDIDYWQGLGTGSIADRTSIKITTASGHSINQSYIIGFVFDHDALGVNHDQPSVKTHYVNSAEFTNYWYKEKLGMFNDLSENGLIFTLL